MIGWSPQRKTPWLFPTHAHPSSTVLPQTPAPACPVCAVIPRLTDVARAVFYALVYAARRAGKTIPIMRIATAPRIEIFFLLVLMPSAIFTTQAASTVTPAAASAAAWCLVLAGLLFAWGAGWVIVWKILVCKSIVFVVLPQRRQSRVSFFGGAEREPSQSYSQAAGRRRSSRSGFVVEGDAGDDVVEVVRSAAGSARASRASYASRLADDEEVEMGDPCDYGDQVLAVSVRGQSQSVKGARRSVRAGLEIVEDPDDMGTHTGMRSIRMTEIMSGRASQVAPARAVAESGVHAFGEDDEDDVENVEEANMMPRSRDVVGRSELLGTHLTVLAQR